MVDKLIDISSLDGSKLPRKRKKYVNKKSKDTGPEKKVQKILKELKIEFETQFPLEGFFYDIYIKSLNILLEVDGDYWHGKNKEFSEMNETQQKSFKRDLLKDGVATKNGYIIKRIWESDITKEKIKELLK